MIFWHYVKLFFSTKKLDFLKSLDNYILSETLSLKVY